jgi:hypothetical protein
MIHADHFYLGAFKISQRNSFASTGQKEIGMREIK